MSRRTIISCWISCPYYPLVDVLSEQDIADHVDEVKAVVKACVAAKPLHEQVIASHCAAVR